MAVDRPVFVDFDDYRLSGSASDPELLTFRIEAARLIDELIGELNTWRDHIARLRSWVSVLQPYEKPAKAALLLEFVGLVAESALAAPYRVNQRMIFAGCRVLEMGLASKGVLQTPPEKVRWGRLVELTSGRNSAKAFVSGLSNFDTKQSQERLDNYRHQAQHQAPPSLELGYQMTATRTPGDGATEYSLGLIAPLPLEKFIDPLLDEHRRAVEAFDKLWVLVRELEQELLQAAHDEASHPGD